MQAPFDLIQSELQAPLDGVLAEREPFAQDLLEVLDLRPPIEPDHVEVGAIAAFQIGAGEQVLHHRLDLGLGECVDLQQHLRWRHLMGQGGHHDVVVLVRVNGAAADRPRARGVQRHQFAARRDDLGFGRIVRSLHMLAQGRDIDIRFVQQPDAGSDDFAQVVRWDVRCHAYRNAGGTIEQDMRHTGWQPGWFVSGAIEVRCEIDRAVTDFREQQLGDRRQLGLGVAHRCKGLRIVGRAEVALP